MRRVLPPLDSLWTFHMVAQLGSLTAAAAALGVTQPAVSKRLKDLEGRLACALVQRGVNAISLTPLGRRYAGELRAIFAQLEEATRNLGGEAAPLRIRAYTTWALRWLIPRLPRFRASHPDIDVEVTTSTATVDLAREGVDAAIRTAPAARRPAPGARPLQPVMVAPFAAPSSLPSGAARRATDDPLLGSKVRSGDWRLWQDHHGLPAVSPLLFESTTLAIQAAMEALGTVICSPAFVRDEVRAGRLISLGEAPLPTGDRYWLILPRGRVRPALQIFANWLMEEAAAEEETSIDPVRGKNPCQG
ncbi:LysR substrate-binding domain-containing protein [Muricoccus radiodurans]|uniref:LysR substrate-binding domain-containing protein n=1 Tax=Muricoccus radiodurans TaxID=2231721 RepID=UPI003CF90690